jgi:hypothetical protein
MGTLPSPDGNSLQKRRIRSFPYRNHRRAEHRLKEHGYPTLVILAVSLRLSTMRGNHYLKLPDPWLFGKDQGNFKNNPIDDWRISVLWSNQYKRSSLSFLGDSHVTSYCPNNWSLASGVRMLQLLCSGIGSS